MCDCLLVSCRNLKWKREGEASWLNAGRALTARKINWWTPCRSIARWNILLCHVTNICARPNHHWICYFSIQQCHKRKLTLSYTLTLGFYVSWSWAATYSVCLSPVLMDWSSPRSCVWVWHFHLNHWVQELQ